MIDRNFWDPERIPSAGPDGVSEGEIRAWEEQRGVRLPSTLAQALMIQNGGCVSGTDLMVDPLQGFTPLSDPSWDHVSFEDEERAEADRTRLFHIGTTSTGLGVVLDCDAQPEPQVLFLWHDLGGELRDEGSITFDQLIEDERGGIET